MCNIWKQKETRELSLKQIRKMLDDPAFKSVEEVILSGGEPTLRDDISSIAGLLVEKCPYLRKITVATNGLIPERVVKACYALNEVCRESNVKLSFSVSLDGLEEVHGMQRGVSNAFKKTTETINSLIDLRQKFNFGLHAHCVITNANIHGFSELKKWCDQKNLPLSFEIGLEWKILLNENCNFHLTEEQKSVFLNDLWTYVKEPISDEYDWMLYRMLTSGIKRHLKCPLVINALIIHPDGNVYYCPQAEPIGNILDDTVSNIYYSEKNLKYREFIRKNHCTYCTQSLWCTLPKNLLHNLRYILIKRIMTIIR